MIRRAILHLLARRDHSQWEILQKLRAKGFAEKDVRPVMTDFVQTDFISDWRFTENYIHWRRNKGYGPLRITMELQARGIFPEMIEDQLKITDNAWFIEAQRVWQKRFKGKQPNDYKIRAKQMRFLQYRGFTREQIDSVFSNQQ